MERITYRKVDKGFREITVYIMHTCWVALIERVECCEFQKSILSNRYWLDYDTAGRLRIEYKKGYPPVVFRTWRGPAKQSAKHYTIMTFGETFIYEFGQYVYFNRIRFVTDAGCCCRPEHPRRASNPLCADVSFAENCITG